MDAVVVPEGTPVPPAEDRIREMPRLNFVGSVGTHAEIYETDAPEVYLRLACEEAGIEVIWCRQVRTGVLRTKLMAGKDRE